MYPKLVVALPLHLVLKTKVNMFAYNSLKTPVFLCCRASKMWMKVNVKFSRTTSDGVLQTTEAGFRIPPQHIAVTDEDIDTDDLAQIIQN